MSDLVTGITTALDIVKKLRDLNKKVSEAEFKMLLADLTSELGDAKLEAANIKIELSEAKTACKHLEEQLAKRLDVEPDLHEGAYVFGDAERHYCTACWDGQGKKVLAYQQPAPIRQFHRWGCPSCNAAFG